jgi:hypothetical protein
MTTQLFSKILVAGLVFLPGIPAKAAQETVPTYRLYDFTAGADIDTRPGLRLAFEIVGMPDGFWGSDVMRRDIELLCKTYSPTFLATSWKRKDAKAAVIRVEVRKGKVADDVVEIDFDTDGMQCLKPRTGL